MDNKNDKQEEPKEDLQPVQGDSSFAETGEEGKGNNTTPNGKEDETINNWVKEIPDSFEEQSEDITETLVNVPVNKGDLPDWINTISPEEPENLESDGNLQENQDNPKPIHFESKDDSRSTEQPLDEERINEQFQGQENIVENHEYLDDGFVEISGYDLDEGDMTTKEPEISDEVNDEQEELPDWLEDMITESPETSSEIKENITEENITEESIFSSDEPTRPVQIVEEIVPESGVEQSIDEVSLTPNLGLDEIDQGVSEDLSEEKSHLIEIEEEKILEESGEIGDMPPIPSQEYKMLTDEVESMSLAEEVQDHEELFSEEEDWQLNDHRLLELPKTLHFAKHLLDQGEIESAYEILQAFIKNKDHLGEIKTWISDMISVEETSNSTPWEILGDIALMQDEPSEALSSYKRALSILLNDKQGA